MGSFLLSHSGNSSDFLMMAILTGVKGYLIIVTFTFIDFFFFFLLNSCHVPGTVLNSSKLMKINQINLPYRRLKEEKERKE